MKKLIIALAIPCVTLLALALSNQFTLSTAKEYEFEIEGYDPRDLLSGHYLRFKIKYPSSAYCEVKNSNEAMMCVDPEFKIITDQKLDACRAWIPGRCLQSQFSDDLNRFYVTEDKSSRLEAAIRGGKATVKVSVAKGKAVIKDLLVDGKSWREF